MFDVSFSRASGPGGQKVNKTSSKATVKVEPWKWRNPQFFYWIPAPILKKLELKTSRYETKSGGILIQSDTTRNRDDNLTNCLEKLLESIKEVVHFENEVSLEDQKKWEALAVDQKERRLYSKKKNSDKKKLRSRSFDI